MYDGRPDRYFDNTADPRKRTQGVEDSDYTRQVGGFRMEDKGKLEGYKESPCSLVLFTRKVPEPHSVPPNQT